MRVKAVALGYYGHKRRHPGDVFEMDEKYMRKVDGKAVLPMWVASLEEKVKGKDLKLPGAKVVKKPKFEEPVEDAGFDSSTGDVDVI